MHALLGAGGQGTRAPVDPQEGPSKGPVSSDQHHLRYPEINMLLSDVTMSTDIQVAFVSMLDSCPTSSMVPGLVWSEDADQADQGPLNPTRLRLGLTLCHRDLRGRVTNGDTRN
ncbi:unnamed protein product [Prunus armeniaca]